MPDERITQALKRAIAASGLTHYRIAKQADVSPSILDHFMSGQRSLRLDTVDKLADVLGLDLTSSRHRNP